MGDVASHTLIVLSVDPDAMRLPSGEKATELAKPLWPLSLRISLPDFVSHILTVLSRNPDAMRLPSGEKATDLTKYCGVG